MLGNEVDRFLQAAVECSLFVSPRDYGLTVAELEDVAKRAGFKQGETRDAIGRLWRAHRLGQDRLMPTEHSQVLSSDFLFVIEPDYREPAAFEFVRTDLGELAREVGEKAAFSTRDEIIERGAAAGHTRHDLDVAISLLLHSGIFEEKGGRVGHAANKLRWPLPSAQIAQQSPGRVPTLSHPAIEQAFPIVKAVMQLRGTGAPTVSGAVASDPKPVVRGVVDVVDSKEKPLVPVAPAPDRKKVFVIHGRCEAARKEMGIFLNSMGLEPVWFHELRTKMGGSTHVIKVVDEGMKQAHGVLALITPDEFSVLRPDMREPTDGGEMIQRWQSRPNVMFEAGMAYMRDPDRVAFVLFGDAKLFSDTAGMCLLWPTNEAGPKSYRAQLQGLLRGGMGCLPNDSLAWMDHGDFDAVNRGLSGVSPRDPFRAGP